MNGNTRVAVWFNKQFMSNNVNVFKFGNFDPIDQNIRARKNDWFGVVSETATDDEVKTSFIEIQERKKHVGKHHFRATK